MFPSSTGTTQDDLETAWRIIRTAAADVKSRAQSLNTLSLAGSIGASLIINFLTVLADRRADLVRFSSVPGLAAYVQAQINNPALDIVAEFNTMATQIDATIAWVVANFPKDGGGFMLVATLMTDGRIQDRTFSTAALANFRTGLQALIATID
jgi:hypothetical protein